MMPGVMPRKSIVSLKTINFATQPNQKNELRTAYRGFGAITLP
jgi:hypothetical protein